MKKGKSGVVFNIKDKVLEGLGLVGGDTFKYDAY